MNTPADKPALDAIRAATDDDSRVLLGLLTAVERNEAVTQRSISRDLGIALGLANGMLKRCVRKGLIKITQAPANRYAYYLTPKGFSEKSRLTAKFLSNSFTLFRVARHELHDLFVECLRQGWKRVALWGTGDLAEIAILSHTGLGVELAGIVDPAHAGTSVSGHRVVAALAELGAVDAVLITDLATAQDSFEAACAGMSAERVLAPRFLHVSRQRPRLVE